MIEQANDQPEWLVKTKLISPRLRAEILPREKLLVLVREALFSHKLTLVTGPAGYGKTTLLASLPAAFPEELFAWISLDREDNRPGQFLGVLMWSLWRLNAASGPIADHPCARLAVRSAETFPLIAAFINNMLENSPEPLAILIDDLHLITEPHVYKILDYLIERMPTYVHLGVASRHQPPLALARLQARGELARFGISELAFTLDETTALLNECLHLVLSQEELSFVQQRTEGWPAALRLFVKPMAAHLHGEAHREGLIASVLESDRSVYDYLSDEVLEHQDQEVRLFLLETSVLSELTPALCQAVTGRSDAALLLERIHQGGLFTVIADESTNSLRYHTLFADFLRNRLAKEMPERAAELHCRAARAETDPGRALSHYLAAEAWEPAAALVEQVGEQLLQNALFSELRCLLEALPRTVREERARLTHYQGVCTLEGRDVEAAVSLLERALLMFAESGDETSRCEVLVELANCAFQPASMVRVREFIDQAMDGSTALSRARLLLERARLELLQGDWAGAGEDFAASARLARELGGNDAPALLAGRFSPLFAVLPNALQEMERTCRMAATHLVGQTSPLRAMIAGHRAYIHLWRGQLEEAIQAGERMLASCEHPDRSYPAAKKRTAGILALAHAARGEYAQANRYFGILMYHSEHLAHAETLMMGFLYAMGRVRWLQGKLDDTAEVYGRVCAEENESDSPLKEVLCSMMRALLGMGERHYVQAEKELKRAAAMEQEVRFSLLFGSARLLLARLYLETGRQREALGMLSAVLRECEANGTLGFVLVEGEIIAPVLRFAVQRGFLADLATGLLTQMRVALKFQPVVVPETGQMLTARELEVLGLIADGCSNRQLSERLFISEHTVKSHVVHILSKLDVASRFQAVARARELKILGYGNRP